MAMLLWGGRFRQFGIEGVDKNVSGNKATGPLFPRAEDFFLLHLLKGFTSRLLKSGSWVTNEVEVSSNIPVQQVEH